MATESEWSDFLYAFRENICAGTINNNSHDLNQWQNFFSDFKYLFSTQAIENKILAVPIITTNVFECFFDAFKVLVHEDCKNGCGINVWHVAGLDSDEIRNSSVLSWLIDCHGSHGQGSQFLENLLYTLSIDKNVTEYAKANLPTPGVTSFSQYWTKVESLPLGDMASRVDIEIEGAFTLFIEVKVNATETNNQLERYVGIAKQKAGKNGRWGVLYLTRNGSKPNDANLHEQVIPISWKFLAKTIENQARKTMHKDSFGNQVIKQYCKHISSL